jgi:hypothetical protein
MLYVPHLAARLTIINFLTRRAQFWPWEGGSAWCGGAHWVSMAPTLLVTFFIKLLFTFVI